MCGIYASVSKTVPTHPDPELKQLLCQRGPDHLGELDTQTSTENGTVSLSFASTVLALRGGHIAVQPLVDLQTSSILCWNGEAWKIGHELVEGNDGEAVLDLLTSRTSSLSAFDSVNRVLETIQSISGPFAFVYFDKVHELLYFGRDCLGRRSLLFNVESINTIVQFSSITGTTGGSWREVEADGIYVLAISSVPAHPSLISLPIEYTQSARFPMYRTGGYVDLCQEDSVSCSPILFVKTG
jgi:asparagine synthetase B (glutamine-hydrolysing)